MRIARSLSIVPILSIAVFMAGCLSGGSSTNSGNGGSGGNGSASLKSITLQPQGITVAPTDTATFIATGHYSDGSTKNITSSCNWTSSNTGVATVNATTGVAHAVAAGNTTISATSSGISAGTTLKVAALSNITVAPASVTINPNQTQAFTATAHYANGEQRDVTGQTTWLSSDPTVATIGLNTGLADAIKTGKVTITATYQTMNAIAQLTVRGIVSITVTPIGPAVVTSGTQQFTATANFNDGSHTDVTRSATWSSSNTATATIDSTGLATATTTVGQTEIQATYQTFTDMTALDVTPSPAPFTVADLNGPYVIAVTSGDSHGAGFLVGAITADGAGNFTGTIDANTSHGLITAQGVTGTYTVFPDGRGDMTFAGAVTGGLIHSFRYVLVNGGNAAQIISFDTIAVGHGKLEKQSQACSSFGATDIQGPYAFGQGGNTAAVQATPFAAIGSFTATGTAINGQRDINNNGTVTTQVNFTGSYTQDATTACRYVVTLTENSSTLSFAYYAVSPGSSSGKAYFIETGAAPGQVLGGVAEQQTATALSNQNYVFLASYSGTEGQFQTGGIAGQIGFNSTNVTGGEEDEAPVTGNTPVSITGGTLTQQGTGRYLLSETTSTGSNPNFILSVVSANRFFLLRSDPGANKVAMGDGDAQTATTVANGTYTLRAASLGSLSPRADLGLLYIPQGTCAICGIGDRNVAGTVSSLTLTDQGTPPSTDGFGRGSVALGEPGGGTSTYNLYVATPTKFVVVGESTNSDGFMIQQ